MKRCYLFTDCRDDLAGHLPIVATSRKEAIKLGYSEAMFELNIDNFVDLRCTWDKDANVDTFEVGRFLDDIDYDIALRYHVRG